jgi:hypothetical protein
MLYINKITCAAAVGAAPFVLLGCSQGSEQQAAHRSYERGQTDRNGAKAEDLQSTKAVKGIIGDCLYENHCDRQGRCTPDGGADPDRDKEFIGKLFTLAKKEVAEALGGGGPGTKAATDALTRWQYGDAVPGPLASAIDKMCNAQHHDKAFWGPADLAKIKALKMGPAIRAIKKIIDNTLAQAGLPSDRKEVEEAFDYIGEGLNAASPGLAERALLKWKFGDKVPELAGKLLQRFIAMKLQERHSQNSQQHSQNSQKHSQNNQMRDSYYDHM